MKLIGTLYVICIVIEIYHLLFNSIMLNASKPVLEIYRAIDYYSHAVNYIRKTEDIREHNKYLSDIPEIKDDRTVSIKQIKNALLDRAVSAYAKENQSDFLKFFISSIIEMIYWIAIILLFCLLYFDKNMFALGIVTLTACFLFSFISDKIYHSSRYNKYWIFFNAFDSTILIVLYIYGILYCCIA